MAWRPNDVTGLVRAIILQVWRNGVQPRLGANGLSILDARGGRRGCLFAETKGMLGVVALMQHLDSGPTTEQA